MTFTKTERELLAAAARNERHYVGVDHGVQGPSGRKRHFGVRRHAAAVSLMQKGLLVRVSDDPHGSPLYKSGWGQNGIVYSNLWKLTEAGVALVEKEVTR